MTSPTSPKWVSRKSSNMKWRNNPGLPRRRLKHTSKLTTNWMKYHARWWSRGGWMKCARRSWDTSANLLMSVSRSTHCVRPRSGAGRSPTAGRSTSSRTCWYSRVSSWVWWHHAPLSCSLTVRSSAARVRTNRSWWSWPRTSRMTCKCQSHSYWCRVSTRRRTSCRWTRSKTCVRRTGSSWNLSSWALTSNWRCSIQLTSYSPIAQSFRVSSTSLKHSGRTQHEEGCVRATCATRPNGSSRCSSAWRSSHSRRSWRSSSGLRTAFRPRNSMGSSSKLKRLG